MEVIHYDFAKDLKDFLSVTEFNQPPTCFDCRFCTFDSDNWPPNENFIYIACSRFLEPTNIILRVENNFPEACPYEFK